MTSQTAIWGFEMAFIYTQKVLFRHCDPAQIVFFPRYYEMLNDATEAFFDEVLDWPFGAMHQTEAVPTAQIETKFTAPSRVGDVLDIALSCKRVGRSSLDVAFEVRCGDELRLASKSTLVYVNAQGRPISWPADKRALLVDQLEGKTDEQ